MRMNDMRKAGKRWFVWLSVVYAAGVAARYAIGLFMGRNPFVMPDEALYADIARSIADGTGVMLRGQPVTYTNLLYPLLISPFYALFPAGEQFRAIQLFNCFAMNLAVFPAFAIARRLTGEWAAFGIAVLSLLLPDMLMAQRIMTEAVEYPLFLWTVYLMFGCFAEKHVRPGKAALTGCAAFLLAQAKGGSIALAAAFLAVLAAGSIRRRSLPEAKCALVFAATFAALWAAAHFALAWAGMDFSQPTIYQTQLQAPALDHLKKTLPGLLLYAFFIPVAFGIYPLLLPASFLRRYDGPQRRQVALALLALMLTAAGACYMFFDAETIGNYFAGRIHIRYVFMYLPLFLAFAASPRLEGVRPNAKLLTALGFLLAMTVTVSFGALLSGRRYPVDAISLSYIQYDDPVLDWRLLSEIAMLTFAAGMLALLWRRGWSLAVKKICAAIVMLGFLTANWLGYALNDWNNETALSDDARQAAQMLSGQTSLLVPDSGIYFDNTLSVLDTAMVKAPCEILYGDLCPALGSFGALVPAVPPQYWTENPVNPIDGVTRVVFTPSALSRMVPAAGAQVQYTDNGLFAIIAPNSDGRLLHSALAGLGNDGTPGGKAALYLYDQQLLSKGSVRVYLRVGCPAAAKLTLSSGETSFDFDLDENSDWIYADFGIPAGSTVFKVAIRVAEGAPVVKTYQVE
jgi:hypothetical protein